MSGKEFSIRRAQTEADKEAALRVRHEVFCVEQHVPVEEEYDHFDEEAVHFMILDRAGEAVGTARLLEYHPSGTCKVGRFAIQRPCRRRGLGRALMRVIEEEAGRLGYGRIVLDAQIQVQGFYAGMGYAAEGEVFLDAGIEHVRMTKKLFDF
jgi:predicted GNAT family N-acyltransferase